MARIMRKNESVAEAPLPAETHHHHVQPWALATLLAPFVIVVALALLSLIVWSGAVAVIEKAGYRDSERLLAEILIVGVGLLVIILIVGTAFALLAPAYFRHKERMAELINEREETRARMAVSVTTDSRVLDPDDKRRNQVIIRIGVEALNDGVKKFSQRMVGDYILADEKAPVGKDSRATKEALAWLVERGYLDKRKSGHFWTGKATSLSALQNSLNTPIIRKS